MSETTVAEKIAAQLRRDGFDHCEAADVESVMAYGGVEPSVVGEEYDEALASRILQELDIHRERGF